MKLNKLSSKEEEIIVRKGTEAPFSGKYDDYFESGLYVCRRCGTPLYFSKHKFKSGCGWPSFDDEIPGAVKRLPDSDGIRTEIQCKNCRAHLGHIFEGEHATPKNIRHCVNSISLEFIPEGKFNSEKIVLGGGCFWCIEAAFSMVPGVFSVSPGYAGGTTEKPTYEQVCTGKTGHAEVVEVEFYPKTLSLDELLDVFFMIHDPTSLNRQGEDIGTQYRSIILCTSKEQKLAVEKYMQRLQKSYEDGIVTEVGMLDHFYPAEEKHKEYFRRNPNQPYCQLVISPKIKKLKKKLEE